MIENTTPYDEFLVDVDELLLLGPNLQRDWISNLIPLKRIPPIIILLGMIGGLTRNRIIQFKIFFSVSCI